LPISSEDEPDVNRLQRLTRKALQRVVPERIMASLAATVGWADYVPAEGRVRFGSLRRTTPISRSWGWDRGLPIDRYYIDRFLAQHAVDITGHVLEAGDDSYTRRFGSGVSRSDILHPDPDDRAATLIGDLADGTGLPSDTFDCIVLTETLQLIFDAAAAMATLHRMLKPGGVLLLTVPGITSLGDGTWHHTWHWMFTQVSIRRLAEAHFEARDLRIETHGNVLAASSFLYGIAAGELATGELDENDPNYPVTVTLRAVKRGSHGTGSNAGLVTPAASG
jgi:SAM-dependent methyltransferase